MDLSSKPRCLSHLSRLVFSPFLVAFPVLLLLIVEADAAPKGGSFSVFSLFNLKGKNKFWSESVIRGDFDDLESSVSVDSGKTAVSNYTKAGNIANYLKLLEIDSIYLPVPVNFIFIGFEGKGNYEFKLGPEELEKWFTKIDHIFEHTRVPPIGEVLNPFYKTSIDKFQSHHLPLISHFHRTCHTYGTLCLHNPDPPAGEVITIVFIICSFCHDAFRRSPPQDGQTICLNIIIVLGPHPVVDLPSLPEEDQDDLTVGLRAETSAIRGIEMRIYRRGDVASSCVLCLDEYEVGVEIVDMPCGHRFHRLCLGDWLQRSSTCPLCRDRLPSMVTITIHF